MAKQNKVAADPTRVANIAGQIRAACSPVVMSGADNDQAKQAAKDASDMYRVSREGTFIVLADLSATGNWTQDEIEGAAAAARAISNAQDDKAIATFIGEAKTAMHPFVRSSVPHLTDLRNEVWQAEEDLKLADPTAGTLFKDVFKRKQHMLNAMFNATKDGRRLNDANDMVAFARERAEEQRLDTDKIVKRVKKLQADLAEIYRDFAEEDLGAAISSLESVNAKSLEAAKRDAIVIAVPASTTVVEDEPETETETANDDAPIETHEVNTVGDVFDVLDELNLAA